MKSVLLLAALTLIGACSCATLRPVEGTETRIASVRITNGQGGGTGSIYRSYSTHSLVLTNAHICEVIKDGGLVVTNEGQQHKITSFIPSKVHDLCLIKVKADLGVNTELAASAPTLGSKATVSGHPKLQPHTRTTGDFSDHVIVPIVVGMIPCTEEDMEKITNPLEALMCIFGGKPIIKEFESQYVSALIAPGNSGSAVYDEDGRIAAVVFASQSREYDFAYTVPWEYVYNFIHFESKGLEPNQAKAKTPAATTKKVTTNAYRSIYFENEELIKQERLDQFNTLYNKLYSKLKEGNSCLKEELLVP